ncbi:MAG: SPOR domain-containing protein [Bacteroidetes bacterium]|nr:SPOR domain-containing protein [Bacteroidota bacterium]
MNVQQTIIKGIKEQLFYNDYLVLPNFGGFVLKSNSSHFSASGTLLLPPSKTVSFNAQLKQNDGILATWLQTQLNCNANEALNHLHEFSEFCTSILNTRRRLNLDNIGFFYLDFENNICFEPQQDANFLMKSFGLGAVSIQEIQMEAKEPKKEPAFEDRVITVQTMPVQQKTKRNYSKLIAPSIVTLFFLSLLFLIVSNQKISGKLQASLFSSNNTTTYTPLTYPELIIQKDEIQKQAYIADANGIAALDLEDKTISVKAVESSKTKNSKLKTSNSKHNYEVVLGCFSILENANRLSEKLSAQNIPASVSGKHKGLYVVSIGASSKQQATETLSEIKSVVPKAWIKKAN